MYEAIFKESTTSGAYTVGADEIDLNHSLERQAPHLDKRANDYYNSDNDEMHRQLRDDINMNHGGTYTGPGVACSSKLIDKAHSKRLLRHASMSWVWILTLSG